MLQSEVINRRNFVFTGLTSLVLGGICQGSPSFKLDIQSEITKDAERLRKEREIYTRDNLILNYDEWTSLIESPDSEYGQRGIIKSRIMSLTDESKLVSFMTDEEKGNYKIFKGMFSLDIKKLQEKYPKDRDDFMELVFPTMLDMQVELEKTYKRQFNFENPSPGDRILWFFHFKYAGKYYSEGKKIPGLFNKDK